MTQSSVRMPPALALRVQRPRLPYFRWHTPRQFARFCAALAVLALFLAPRFAVEAADAPPLPNITAKELRALRGANTSQELHLTYGQTAEPLTGTTRETTLTTVEIGLGPDYFHVTDGATRVIYDFAINRIVTLDLGGQTFRHHSLDAEVYSRVAEGSNRRRLAESLPQELRDDPAAKIMVDPVWNEVELGIPLAPPHSVTTEVDVAGQLRIFYGEQELATLSPHHEQPLSERLTAIAARLFRNGPLVQHPIVSGFVEGSHMMPLVLASLHPDGRGGFVRRVLNLEGVREARADYPLPEEFEPAGISPNSETLRQRFATEMLPIMLEAAAGTHGDGPPSEAEYVRRIKAAFERADYMSVFLLVHAWHDFFVGDPDEQRCPEIGNGLTMCEVRNTAQKRGGERVVAFFEATQMALQSPEESAAAFRSIERTGLEGTEVLDEVEARILMRSLATAEPHIEEMPQTTAIFDAFVKALHGNPYTVALYYDIGLHLLWRWRFDLAWTVWDIGRALPNRWSGDDLTKVEEIESNLRRDYAPLYYSPPS